MFPLVATTVVFLILSMIVFQTMYVLNYRNVLAGKRSSHIESESNDLGLLKGGVFTPSAAIILCLKGAEPSLVECLSGLVSQDYPDFQINIVVDSPEDPASEIVNEFFANVKHPHRIEYLKTPFATCSLKCSAITQAIESLPNKIEVVAFVDADAVVDETWLTDLVMPLKDRKVGATTGNRWYSPVDGSLGSYVRKVWNAAAVVQMQRYKIAWGGSLAMRKETIDQCGLIGKWRRTFCEDTPLSAVFKDKGLRLHRVPNLIIEDRSDVSLLSAFSWISRQLLVVRLHHPAWKLVLLHGVATMVVSVVAPLLVVLLFMLGNSADAWLLLKMVVVYQVCNFGLLWLIGRSNRKVIDGRNSHNGLAGQVSKNGWLEFVATFATQVLQPLAVWNANSMEKVEWAGVEYKVEQSDDIRLLDRKRELRTAEENMDLPSTDSNSETDPDSKSDTRPLSETGFFKRSRN